MQVPVSEGRGCPFFYICLWCQNFKYYVTIFKVVTWDLFFETNISLMKESFVMVLKN